MKFSLTTKTNDLGLFQIKAEINFGNIAKGELGGFIEKESNLSQYGDAWVYGDARVYGNAQVSGDARVKKTKDYFCISGLGNESRTITITFSNKKISAGCFLGSITEFEIAVNKKYPNGSDYLTAIKFIYAMIEQRQ